MKNCLLLIVILVASIAIKFNYDPKKGYSYTISGNSAEEVIDAEVKIKNYLRKGKIPPLPKKEEQK